MGKLNGVLRMLFLLKEDKVIKKQEIANELGVSLKQVSRYKEELDEFFTIECISGKNGGYRLKKANFPFKKILNKDEIKRINKAISFMETSTTEKEKVSKEIKKNY